MPEPTSRRSTDYTLEEKRALVGGGITLDGYAAVVSNAASGYATVTRSDTQMSVEFAWGTIERARTNSADLSSK